MPRFLFLLVLFLVPQSLYAQDVPKYSAPEQVRASFKKLLDRPKAPFAVKFGPDIKTSDGKTHAELGMTGEIVIE